MLCETPELPWCFRSWGRAKGGGRLEELFVVSAAERTRFGWPEPGWDSEAGSCLCTSHPAWTRCWVQAEQKCNGRKGPEPTQQLLHPPHCFVLVPKLSLPHDATAKLGHQQAPRRGVSHLLHFSCPLWLLPALSPCSSLKGPGASAPAWPHAEQFPPKRSSVTKTSLVCDAHLSSTELLPHRKILWGFFFCLCCFFKTLAISSAERAPA